MMAIALNSRLKAGAARIMRYGGHLNKNVVRIQTEMFKPGAVVRGPRLDVYADPPANSVWWPRAPHFIWLDDPQAGPSSQIRFDEGAFFFTFAAVGTEINGHSHGAIDYLMQTRTAAELFRPDLANLALLSRDRFESLLNQACWATLAVYDVDVVTGKVEFYAGLELEELNEESEAAEGEAA